MTAETELIRRRILETAAQLFVTRGYDGVSMREIAEASHLSKAGIYYHFKDKEDLFVAILNDSLDELNLITCEAAATGRLARDQIGAFIHIIFSRLPADRRNIIRLANQELSHLSEAQREDFGRRYETAFIHPIEQILADGIARGELRTLPPSLLVWGLLGLMYPFFAPGRSSSEAAAQSISETILTIFFDGVRRDDLSA